MLLGSAAARPVKLSVEAETMASLVRSLSAISLTFIIMVTPWAILQVITSVTMDQPPPSLDFIVNILFTSYNYLSPFIFWLLNPRMRRTTDLALYDLVISYFNSDTVDTLYICRLVVGHSLHAALRELCHEEVR